VGAQVLRGGIVTDVERYTRNLSVSGSWNVLNFSNLRNYSAARTGVQAAEHFLTASQQDVIYNTRRQYYEVVRAVKLSDVATGSLRLARDDERRVRALFEVGSVSKSDLLRAQVRTSQSQLDSLVRRHAVTVQRNLLARQIGITESQMGDVDTVLTVEIRDFNEEQLLTEAEQNRPDLKAVDAEWRSAKASHSAARMARLPYVTLSGSMGWNPWTHQKTTDDSAGVLFTPQSVKQESDRTLSGTVAITWDIFDGLATDSRIASARARLLRAEEQRDLVRRSLAQDVHEAWITYREAIEADALARRSVESATENLNLTQQKYNVGSATILDLIDAQVQLLQAQSDMVSAQAGIRVAEAGVERIRGTGR
jgi:outer membrane protein TolC